MFVTIFDGENTGQYEVNTISITKSYLKIVGTFKKTTSPDNAERFCIHTILNTISG